MDVSYLRTPDSRFQNLPGFPYQPHYLQNGKLRMAYIDEEFSTGGSVRETFLCIHGQPTWSYLYRKMIPILLRHTTNPNALIARRVVAPDLFGFGRSDKPTDDGVYTYNFHRNSLLHLVRSLDLRNITLVVQDWGGILGLTLPLEEPWRFKRLIVMNTTLPSGQDAGQGFKDWRAFSNRNPDMAVGKLLGRSAPHLTQAERDAYDAPYPDKRYKGGVRRFPNLVMTDPEMEGVDISKRAIAMYHSSNEFKTRDIFMACGMKDPVLGPSVMKNLSRIWKNGCLWTEIADGGHFVQERGEQVARLAIESFESETGLVQGVQKIDPQQAKL